MTPEMEPLWIVSKAYMTCYCTFYS